MYTIYNIVYTIYYAQNKIHFTVTYHFRLNSLDFTLITSQFTISTLLLTPNVINGISVGHKAGLLSRSIKLNIIKIINFIIMALCILTHSLYESCQVLTLKFKPENGEKKDVPSFHTEHPLTQNL